MKKFSILLALISTGLLLGSCRQSSFIAEDDVYSSGSSTVYANDRSNASYSNYVYSKESSSGTKSAYYNPEDTSLRNDSQQLTQGASVVNNYYYGNDYMYNSGWYGPSYVRYRPYSVWWSWGYDPFFNPRWYWGPSYAWGWGYNSWGWGYGHGWGYNPYGWGYGYNPYAWGHGWGYNPYGWGGNCGIYGGGNVFINNGNIYNFGGQGMTTFTNTGGSFYKSGNQFVGKRPGMSGTSAPYKGPDKVKSAISANGQPTNVRNLTTADRTLKSQGKDIASTSAPRVSRGTIQTEKLTEGSTPWSPRTTARNITPAKEGSSVNRVNGNGVKPTVNDRNTISNGTVERGTVERGTVDKGAINRPSVPVNTRTETPATVRPNEGVRNQGNTRIDNNRQPTISRPVENQYNRSNPNSGYQRVAPQPSQQRQNMSQPSSRPSNNRIQAPSSSPSRGGSYSSPSRGSSGGSMSSPSRGSNSGRSSGGSSRGGGFSRP